MHTTGYNVYEWRECPVTGLVYWAVVAAGVPWSIAKYDQLKDGMRVCDMSEPMGRHYASLCDTSFTVYMDAWKALPVAVRLCATQEEAQSYMEVVTDTDYPEVYSYDD